MRDAAGHGRGRRSTGALVVLSALALVAVLAAVLVLMSSRVAGPDVGLGPSAQPLSPPPRAARVPTDADDRSGLRGPGTADGRDADD